MAWRGAEKRTVMRVFRKKSVCVCVCPRCQKMPQTKEFLLDFCICICKLMRLCCLETCPKGMTTTRVKNTYFAVLHTVRTRC